MRSLLRFASFTLTTSMMAHAVGAQPPVQPQPMLEVVKSFDAFKLVGIAVSREGRIFASAPAALDGDKVIEIDPATGAVKAYPGENWQQFSADGRAPWFAPQALWVDDRNDLWVLDSGHPTLPTSAPTGNPKLIRIDLRSNTVLHTYDFGSVVAAEDSLNDVRIDLKRGKAYIANIGREGSLVILDLASGKSRQVLVGDVSTRADPSEHMNVGGQEALVGKGVSLRVHADGIALSPDAEWLYYRTLTDHNYWRIPTRALADDSLSAKQLSAKVEFLGKGPITGGIIMDARGTLYGGDLENGTIVALTRPAGSRTLVSQTFIDAGARLAWADGFAISGGYLYVADARLSETAFKNHLPKRGVPTIFRVKLPAAPAGPVQRP